ncbi:MAG: hypothetical protein KAI51_00455 [Candidatus Aenigmarchaeota archaeon]|nr:hypothetical protein [Candidatus Aenigmarchaeota archaeon]
MEHIPEQSERIFRRLDGISDWDDPELNVWRLEYSVVCLYNHYYGKLEDKNLYNACTGLVGLMRGMFVLDPVIVYLEIMKTGESSKQEFVELFESNREQYEQVYEDFPDILDEEFFDYSFGILQRAGLLKIYDDKLKVKDMFMFDIDSLIAEGVKKNDGMDKYIESLMCGCQES